MRYKITKFLSNIKPKLFSLNILILMTFLNVLYANSTYKMTIENIEVKNSSSVQASIYIENSSEEILITSYQCALSIDQNIDLSSLTLTYIENSSELLNEPNLFVGIDNIDGPTELTFVSYIGNDIIRNKTLVGNFLLEGNIDIASVNLLNIQWDFEGTISTIITGKNFENITNPSFHQSIFATNVDSEKIAAVKIIEAVASESTSETFNESRLFDGINSFSNGGEYNSNSEGRWLAKGFPQWVTIDLGEETLIDHINLDAFGSENGISYDCEFYSGTYNNKTFLDNGTTKTGQQWSEYNFTNLRARHLTLVITGSNGNDYCDFWEIEVFGNNSTTGIDGEKELAEQSTLPTDFGMSQNYPNPFNPSTKVEVMMKKSENARLSIYNLLGEKVLTVLDSELSAGIHEVSIDGSSLASGIYIYKLDIGNRFSQIKKMNLIK